MRSIHSLLIPLLLSLTAHANAQSNEVAGTTEAQFSVSSDGAATYTVPLKVPPGTGGMEPKLALSYSGRGGPSAYGHGWAVSGLSVIQRGPRNLRDDGEVRGVQLDPDDAFYLDGEKLVEVPTTAAGAREYRSRIDNVSRIRAYDWGPTGPGRFTVETRSGLVMSFGALPDSVVKLLTGNTISWLCDRITDRSGNYMTFHYRFDDVGGENGLEYLIDHVSYTGNSAAGLVPYAELKFNYDEVPAYGTRFMFGQKTVQKQRLQSIVSSYQGTVLRKYVPRFSTEANEFFQRLESITEEGLAGTHFRPIKLEYTKADPHWVPRSLMSGIQSLPGLGDVSAGVGTAYRLVDDRGGQPVILVAAKAAGKLLREQFVYDAANKRWAKTGTPPAVILGTDDGVAGSVAVIDVNGDGKDDLISNADSVGNVDAVYINAGGGSWTTVPIAPPVPVLGGSVRESGLLPVDLPDGSGGVRAGFIWDVDLPGQPRRNGAAYWDGAAWKQVPDYKPPHALSAEGRPLSGVFAVDVDADGQRELLYLQRLVGGTTRSDVYKLGPKGWDKVADPNLKTPIAVPPSDAALRLIDINGDGFRDLVVSYADASGPVSAIFLTSRTGWQRDLQRHLPAAYFWTPELAGPNLTLAEIADLNGDGAMDIFEASAARRVAWKAVGNDWIEDDLLKPPSLLPAAINVRDRSIKFRSLDGDAQQEWLNLAAEDGLVPAVYSFLPATGWSRDKNYVVPVEISVFDKVDLGVRFIDLNGDGYQDVVWSRRRKKGDVEEAAYVFTPNAATAWQKDDRFILPEVLVNEDYKDAGVMLADIDGDGLIDVLVGRRSFEHGKPKDRLEAFVNCSRSTCTNSPVTLKSAFWKAASTVPEIAGLVPPEVFVEDDVGSRGAQLMDMNGDGRTDIVMSRTVESWVPTTREERRQSNQTRKPVYELYSRTWLNKDGRAWDESAPHRLPVPLVRPIVRDKGKGDPEGFAGTKVIETRAQLFDVNNDRIPDVIYNYQVFELRLAPMNQYVPVSELRAGARLWRNGGWSDAPAYTPPRRLDDDTSAEKRQVHFSDLNADTLVDLIYAEGSNSETRLNTGVGWSAADAAYKLPADAIRDSRGDQGFRFIDINGDQLPDLVSSWTTADPAKPVKGVRLNTGIGWSTASLPALAPPVPFAEYERGDNGVRAVDVNGDGLQDFIQAYKRSDSQIDRYVYVNETDTPFLLFTVTDGMGFQSQVRHRSFLAYQYPEDKALAPPPPPVRLSTFEPSEYPYIHAPLPGFLVTELKTQGTGVPARKIIYQYSGYRVDVLSGRSLGFNSQVTVDTDRKRSTTVRYLQTDGYLGAPDLIQLRQGEALISETATGYKLTAVDGLARAVPGGGSFTPIYYKRLVEGTSTKVWDLKGVLLSGQEDRFLEYDEYSNPKVLETHFADGSVTVTESRYDDRPDNWVLGRLAYSTARLSSPHHPAITRASSFTYEPLSGLLKTETANAGTNLALTTTYQRDKFGNKVGVTVATPGGQYARTESFTPDPEGRFIVEATNALNHRTTTGYDWVSGAVTSRTDANGLTFTYIYDGLQRQVREISPTGVKTETSLVFASPSKDVVAVSSRKVGSLPPTVIELDAAGRAHRTRQTGWAGKSIISGTEYDVLGRIVAVSLPRFAGERDRRLTRKYDDLDRIFEEVQPDGSTATAVYDGLTVIRTDPQHAVSKATSDLRGRVVFTEDALKGKTRFEFDSAGRIASTTNALDQVTIHKYDVAGRREKLLDPTSGTWSYTYTIYGQVETQTDPRGRVVTMTYDALGRIKTRTASGRTTSWTYDTKENGVGLLSEVATDPQHSRAFTYDRFARLFEQRMVIGDDALTTRYEYDLLGRVLRTLYGTGVRATNSYDALGFWRSVTVSDGTMSSVAYQLGEVDAGGRIKSEILGNGIRVDQKYDDQTSLLRHSKFLDARGKIVQDLTLDYDALGNLEHMSDTATGESYTYTYDALGRLKDVVGNRGPPVSVTYDALGNIKTKGGAVYNYCDRGSQQGLLCSVQKSGEVAALEYDQAGNVTQFGRQSLVFDDEGRAVSIELGSADKILRTYSKFTYGPDGQLQTQQSRHNTTSFDVSYFNDVELIREHFTDPSLPTRERTRVRHFLAGPSGVIGYYEKLSQHFPLRFASPAYGAIVTAKPERVTRLLTGFVFFAKDHLGSIRALLTADGSVIQRFEYDPWGKSLGKDGYRTVRQGFTGHEMLDALGLIHMGGRIYSPELGRFLSPDPYLDNPGFSQSHNRYAYVLNNPLNLVDPSGLRCCHLPSIGQVFHAVGSAVGAIVDATIGKPLAWVGEQLAKGGRWLQQNWQVVVIVAATVALGPAGTLAGAMLTGAAIGGLSAALYGGSFEDILRGAALGALTGGAFYGAGTVVQQYKLGTMAAATTHGVVGGTASIMQGGRFESGFLSSFVSRSLGGEINKGSTVGERVARAAIVGGVASEVGGGSFENGAITSAFAQMYNEESHKSRMRDFIKEQGRTKLNTDFERNLFDRWWEGDSSFGLTEAEFKEITAYADAHPDRVQAGPNPNEFVVTYYDDDKYDYSLGTATLTKDQAGNWVGMRDTYNFDSKPPGTRPWPAELATRATGFAQSIFGSGTAKDMKVCYPPAACGAPSREPPKPLLLLH